IGLIADADEACKAQPALSRQRDDGQAKGAALRAESNVALRWKVRSERRIQTDPWIGVENSQTVGSDHAHAVTANFFEKLLLALPAFGADLSEPGGDDDRRPRAARGAVIDHRIAPSAGTATTTRSGVSGKAGKLG